LGVNVSKCDNVRLKGFTPPHLGAQITATKRGTEGGGIRLLGTHAAGIPGKQLESTEGRVRPLGAERALRTLQDFPLSGSPLRVERDHRGLRRGSPCPLIPRGAWGLDEERSSGRNLRLSPRIHKKVFGVADC